MTQDEDDVGYGKPPRQHRFQKGRSGNPKGRPKKERPPNDMRSILEKAANEEVEVGDQVMTMLEIEVRALQRKAAKGDVAASRHINKLREQAGCDKPEQSGGGVLVVPGTRPLEEWSIAVAKQQAKFRSGHEGEEED